MKSKPTAAERAALTEFDGRQVAEHVDQGMIEHLVNKGWLRPLESGGHKLTRGGIDALRG